MNGLQSKMARSALGLGVRELARAAQVSPDTVARLERGELLKETTVDAIRAKLTEAGVEFTNGSNPGVRLHPHKKVLFRIRLVAHESNAPTAAREIYEAFKSDACQFYASESSRDDRVQSELSSLSDFLGINAEGLERSEAPLVRQVQDWARNDAKKPQYADVQTSRSAR